MCDQEEMLLEKRIKGTHDVENMNSKSANNPGLEKNSVREESNVNNLSALEQDVFGNKYDREYINDKNKNSESRKKICSQSEENKEQSATGKTNVQAITGEIDNSNAHLSDEFDVNTNAELVKDNDLNKINNEKADAQGINGENPKADITGKNNTSNELDSDGKSEKIKNSAIISFFRGIAETFRRTIFIETDDGKRRLKFQLRRKHIIWFSLIAVIFALYIFKQSLIVIEKPQIDLGKKVVIHLPTGSTVYTYENLIVNEKGKFYYEGERNKIDLTGGELVYEEWE